MSENELIDLGKAILPVAQVCRLLGVPRSSYYERCARRPGRRALANAVLAVHVRAEFERSRGRYGSPRVTHALRRRGLCVSRKRIARLMRREGLIARPN